MGRAPLMGRAAVLSRVLGHLIDDDSASAIELCAHEYRSGGGPYLLGLQSLAQLWACDFATAAATAARALSGSAQDAEALLLARAVAGFAAAGWPSIAQPDAYSTDQLATDQLAAARAEVDLIGSIDADCRAFIYYLLAEASLAAARLDLAEHYVREAGELPTAFLNDGTGPHPFLAMMYVMRIRLLAFQARITEALALGAQAEQRVDHPTMVLLLEATMCLVRGNAGQRASAKAIARRLQYSLGEPDSYLSSGCYLLVAFGLVATGDAARAAEFVLSAGGNAGLDRLAIVDRALGLELLVAAAVVAEDLDAAEAWRTQAELLADHPIAAPTYARLASRVELLAGRADSAIEWAEQAVRAARGQGRIVEAAEAEIVLSRARIALAQGGAASVALELMVARALDSGHLAARHSAARELRGIGRRLRPTPGSGWDGLSTREREVALLIVEGFGNRRIAGQLYLSEHTVRVHVSRVLAAFGVASRAAAASKLAGLLPEDSSAAAPPALTPRQRVVVEYIVLGYTNLQIGCELGLSVKTVEKHVGEILRRWGITSRAGIARLASSVLSEVRTP